MHVVIATGLYPPEIGGPATFSAFFEKELQARSIPCTVVPFSAVRHLPKGIRHIAYFIRIFRAIQKGSIVLALDPVSVGLPACVAAQLKRAPFYLRAGGDYAWEQAAQRWGFTGLPEEFPGKARLPMAAKLLVLVERYVARRARRVLTQSGHLASIVGRWGIKGETIVVIPNGVTPLSFSTKEEIRSALGWGDEVVVVSAGRFVPWKGFAAVMDACASLADSYPGIRLYVAGAGPQERELKAKAAKLPFRIEFPGALPTLTLMRAIHAADVFVLNTRYEGFSHQILEAMASGAPVVTTDIGGNADLAQDGETALLVHWDDAGGIQKAMTRLLEDHQLARRIADGAKKRASTFTPERTFIETCRALGIAL